jgi:hypothetical protein
MTTESIVTTYVVQARLSDELWWDAHRPFGSLRCRANFHPRRSITIATPHRQAPHHHRRGSDAVIIVDTFAPSKNIMQRVYDVLHHAHRPVAMVELEQLLPFDRETLRRAIKRLREAKCLRVQCVERRGSTP